MLVLFTTLGYVKFSIKKMCVVCVYVCVYVGEMEWKSGSVQSGGGVSRDALHHQQRRSHLSKRPPGQRNTRPGLYNCKPSISKTH